MNSVVQIATISSHLPPNSIPPVPNPHRRKQTLYRLQKCRNPNQIAPTHADIIKNGEQHDNFVVFELLRVCSKWKGMDYALKVFEQIPDPNVYLYTALIDGFLLSGLNYRGIRVYLQMIESSVYPDEFVFVSVLKACGIELDLRLGKGIHAQVLKLGLRLRRQVALKLLELYGKCGEFEDMEKVFDEMPDPDTVAMTVMISSYFDHQLVERACEVFDMVKTKDTVFWTAMIDGLVRNREFSKALASFRQMQSKGVRVNEHTVVCVLSACAQLGALELGKWMHSYIKKYDLEVNHFVASALLNMYSRCGSIDEAVSIFNQVIDKEVSTYNSMIVGFALNGKSIQAVEMFERMTREGTEPTSITFVGVLNACSHGGLVDVGLEIFNKMRKYYKIEPQVEHYGCMVDLLGRAGQIEEAYGFVQKMHVPPDHVIWGSLLSACKAYRNYEIGKRVADKVLDDGSSDIGSYVLVSNFYSLFGKWEEALLAREKMKGKGVLKEPGCSFIEVNNELHEFLLGDTRHPQKKAIYQNLEEMSEKLRLEGYRPQIDVVPQDIDDQEKEWALAIHSERLAISYGLVSTEACSTLRIVKNLRVCEDCHTVIKLISKITQRRIIMRDRNRFHHFENGSCSCGDYW